MNNKWKNKKAALHLQAINKTLLIIKLLFWNLCVIPGHKFFQTFFFFGVLSRLVPNCCFLICCHLICCLALVVCQRPCFKLWPWLIFWCDWATYHCLAYKKKNHQFDACLCIVSELQPPRETTQEWKNKDGDNQNKAKKLIIK